MMLSETKDFDDGAMSGEPERGRPGVRRFVWSALIYSAVISAVAWLTPLWQSSPSVQAVFGGDVLAPVILFVSLMAVGLILDVSCVVLTLAIVAKPTRKPNLLVCGIALFLLVTPVVVDTIYSAVISSGASS
jgi:hypothetical protein